MPVDRLDLQLQSFTRWYRPCSATEFVSQIRRREAPSKDALLVTFDDAYLDNRQLAAACLRRHGVQGLIFVPSGYIESTCRFWWVRINDIIRCASKKSILEAHSALGDYPDVQQVFRQSNVDEWIGRRVLRARLAEILTRVCRCLRGKTCETCARTISSLARIQCLIRACLDLLGLTCRWSCGFVRTKWNNTLATAQPSSRTRTVITMKWPVKKFTLRVIWRRSQLTRVPLKSGETHWKCREYSRCGRIDRRSLRLSCS
jgi:hypothetical protein